MITQMVYISEYTGQNTEADLEAILQACRTHNEALSVTGLLIFVGGSFIQVLEAEDSRTLHGLFDRIAHDTRHTRVDILLEQQLPRRLFSNWSMAWLPLSNEDFSRITGVVRCDYETLLELDSNIVSTIIQTFAESKLFS
jgi:hypothetical protein